MTQSPPPPPPAPPSGAANYPVIPKVDSPPEIKRWLPFVAWFLAIPHYIVLIGLWLVAAILQLVAVFVILFTKRMPDGIYRFIVMTYRYNWRVSIYTNFLVNEYPPFEFNGEAADGTPYAAQLSFERPAEYNRWLPLVKWLLAFPHYVVLAFLGWAANIVSFVMAFFVLFTKKWPEGVRDFVIGVMRWSYRVNGYVGLLVDPYPPFSLDE